MTLLERLGGREAITRGIVHTFRILSRRPRPSRHEEAAGEELDAYLRGLGLSPVRDGAGNRMADVPPAPGRGRAPRLILQGHLDMVCAVRPGSGWNPLTDPVAVVVEGGFLRSDGRSSLGADNHLGNAAALWLLSTGAVNHGPLRLLFTTAEEVGLEGAKEVAPDWLAGAEYLLNTDGFHLGRAVVGSASGRPGRPGPPRWTPRRPRRSPPGGSPSGRAASATAHQPGQPPGGGAGPGVAGADRPDAGALRRPRGAGAVGVPGQGPGAGHGLRRAGHSGRPLGG
ncbi:MAG: M20/M25/M40 family metallo-hydrolase [Flavonifractor plautii]